MIEHKLVLNPKSYRMAHPVYSQKEVEKVKYTHKKPEGLRDRFAHFLIWSTRKAFDLVSNYNPDKLDERGWLNRIIFLETIAGVPGMIGGMQRHLRSLRTLERDHGWIHHLLQEAENERMHLFFFLKMRNPGILYRMIIAGGQAVFFNLYFFMYMISPSSCHRYVGYLEEEAVHTYTVLIDQIDKGNLPIWGRMKAEEEAREYYQLPDDASFRDMVVHVRADEACHRDLNHHFADIPFYQDVDSHTVTIIENEHAKEEEPQQKLTFKQQAVLGDGKESDEKDTKV